MTRLVALNAFPRVRITVADAVIGGVLAGLREEDRGMFGIVESYGGNRYFRAAADIEVVETPAGSPGDVKGSVT